MSAHSSDDVSERGLVTALADVFVFAPIGIIEKVRTDYGTLVAAGRLRVQTARWVGEMALHLARQKGPGWVFGVVEPRVAPVINNLTDREPFDGYDALPAAEVVRLLRDLPTAERDMVRTYESARRGRRTILAALDRLTTQ